VFGIRTGADPQFSEIFKLRLHISKRATEVEELTAILTDGQPAVGRRQTWNLFAFALFTSDQLRAANELL